MQKIQNKNLIFLKEKSGIEHAIATYNIEYSHINTSVFHRVRFFSSWSPRRRMRISLGWELALLASPD
jgi:hypothetical protein